MKDSKTYIELPNGDIELDFLLDQIKTARLDKWEYQKWFARPALIDKNGGSSRLYTGQTFNKKYINLVENGWTHDHCEICSQTLADYDEVNNYGYFNGQSWICNACHDTFMTSIDIEKEIEKYKRKIKYNTST